MAKCRHRLPYFLDKFHGLETPPIIEDEYEEDQASEHDIEPQYVQPTPTPDDVIVRITKCIVSS